MIEAEIRYPRLMVISHNCFSKSGSNGRTLANFFINWPKESLSQFYIINEVPDSDICSNYFRVTDIEALKSCYKKVEVGRRIDVQNLQTEERSKDGNLNKIYNRSRKRTPIFYIVRNFIWNRNKWKNEKYESWINDFNPNVVFLQVGDYAFMIRIALDIALNRNIPVVIYNCEDHYLKEKKSFSPLYKYYRLDYKHQVEKLFKYSSFSIYNSEMLKYSFQNQFKIESDVIMTSTNITPLENKMVNAPLKVSYLGNLGLGRHVSLIEIAEELHELDANIYLDVYGKSRDEKVEKSLSECAGVKFKGFVPYDEVVNIMQRSDILVHVENFSSYYQWYLKHAFSTKISDCLGSGTCLFIYAPKSIAFTKYLSDNNAACVVTDKNSLQESLEHILADDQLRKNIADNALILSHLNHDANTNAIKIRDIIFRIAEK